MTMTTETFRTDVDGMLPEEYTPSRELLIFLFSQYGVHLHQTPDADAIEAVNETLAGTPDSELEKFARAANKTTAELRANAQFILNSYRGGF
jgi:hypothetical protein